MTTFDASIDYPLGPFESSGKTNMKHDDVQDVFCDKQLVAKGGHISPFFRLPLSFLFVASLLIGGLNYWSPTVTSAFGIHRPMTMLEHSGAVLLNASQLKDHISLPMHGTHRRYWLGPLAGASYTTNCVQPGILKVNYFNSPQTFSEGIQPDISVTAYENQAKYNEQLQLLTGNSPTIVVDSRGDVLSYDTAALNMLIIEPKFSQELITVKYSTPQSVLSMLHDSQNLVEL